MCVCMSVRPAPTVVCGSSSRVHGCRRIADGLLLSQSGGTELSCQLEYALGSIDTLYGQVHVASSVLYIWGYGHHTTAVSGVRFD